MRFAMVCLTSAVLLWPLKPAHAAEAPLALPTAPSTEFKAVALTRVVVEIPAGKVDGTLQRGFFCSVATTATSSGAKTEYNIAPVQTAFREEMHSAGLKTDDSSENLFEPQGTASAAEFSLGGVVTDRNLRVCFPSPSGADAVKAKGEDTMTVEWQLYSRSQNQVVARFHTTGSFELKDPTPGGLVLISNGVFAANVRALAAQPAFREALAGRYAATSATGEPTIALEGAALAPTRPVELAATSVAVVFAGSAQGSAFLVSSDGYLVTDAHVVGEAKTVRLRWSDGKESVGEVVRVSKRRDTAIIKTDAQGRAPLPLRREHPMVGETVYAIGAPLGQKFQGTVTRGVVSAERTENGHNYIQSDVVVQMGSSGGPLLDISGRVVGVAEGLNGFVLPVSAGLNYFTPTADVMDALHLQPR